MMMMMSRSPGIVSHERGIFCVDSRQRARVVRVAMSMARMVAEAHTAATHVSISTQVGYFEGRHLTGNLPELRCQKYDRPRQLKSSPEGDRH